MRNIILFSFFTFFTFTSYSQDIRVPFRVGDKLGISDKDGNIKVKAEYDNITYLGNHYFQFTNVKIDSIIGYNGKMTAMKTPTTGVIFNDKLLINHYQYKRYFILENALIVGSENEFRPEKCKLFNINGIELLEEEFKGLYINDERSTGYLDYIDDQYIFISIFHKRNGRSKKKFSIVIYDKKGLCCMTKLQLT